MFDSVSSKSCGKGGYIYNYVGSNEALTVVESSVKQGLQWTMATHTHTLSYTHTHSAKRFGEDKYSEINHHEDSD